MNKKDKVIAMINEYGKKGGSLWDLIPKVEKIFSEEPEQVINNLVKEAHQNAVDHGWWEEDRAFGELIALMHSELSEALEEFRNGFSPSDVYFIDKLSGDPVFGIKEGEKPEGIPIELADTVIRIFDFCGRNGIDLEDAIRIKMEYNKGRPYRHGKKKA